MVNWAFNTKKHFPVLAPQIHLNLSNFLINHYGYESSDKNLHFPWFKVYGTLIIIPKRSA